MTLKLSYDVLHTEHLRGENAAQTTVEGTIVVPGEKPAIAEVMTCTANIRLTAERIADEGDKVEVEGLVDIAITYTADVGGGEEGGSAQVVDRVAIPGALTLSTVADLPGADPTLKTSVKAKVQDIQCEVRADGRTVDIDVIVRLTASATESVTRKVISDASTTPVEQARVEKELVRIEDVAGRGTGQSQARGLLELPEELLAAERVISVTAQVRPGAVRVAQDRVTAEGTLDLLVLYETRKPPVSTGEAGGEEETSQVSEQPAVYAAEFTGQVDYGVAVEIPGVRAGMSASADVSVVSAAGAVLDGGREIAVDVDLAGNARAYQLKQVAVVTDIHSTSGNAVEVRRELLRVDDVIGETTKQTAVEGVIEIPDGKPPVGKILGMTAAADVTNVRIAEDKVIVEGAVDLELVYVAHASDGPQLQFCHWTDALTFEQAIALSGTEPGMNARVSVGVVGIDPDLINRETIEVDVELRTAVKVTESVQKEVVVEAVECPPPDPNPPSLTFVVVQPGDTLWKLSRRYGTGLDAILQANSWLSEVDQEEKLPVGAKLCIPRALATIK